MDSPHRGVMQGGTIPRVIHGIHGQVLPRSHPLAPEIIRKERAEPKVRAHSQKELASLRPSGRKPSSSMIRNGELK